MTVKFLDWLPWVLGGLVVALIDLLFFGCSPLPTSPNNNPCWHYEGLDGNQHIVCSDSADN